MAGKLVPGFLIINFIGMLVLVYLHFNDKEKLVYIDSAKVIDAYHGMAEARQQYQAKITVWKSNIDTLATEVQNEIAKFMFNLYFVSFWGLI